MTNEEALKVLKYRSGWNLSIRDVNALDMAIKALEQESQTFEWCTDCREYDQEKHCCHRWSKVIRNTVEEMKQSKVGHWIPVNKMLPEPRIDVWCDSDMGQMVGYYDEYVETWYGRDYLELMVTAWMPLPEPYEPQESEVQDADSN